MLYNRTLKVTYTLDEGEAIVLHSTDYGFSLRLIAAICSHSLLDFTLIKSWMWAESGTEDVVQKIVVLQSHQCRILSVKSTEAVQGLLMKSKDRTISKRYTYLKTLAIIHTVFVCKPGSAMPLPK